MIKRLISFLLTLVLLVAIPLEARYRYNPYTRKLDFYEAAGDIVLGDIGDITLTGLANGDLLYYNGTAWVNLNIGAGATVLTVAGGIPSWQAAPAPAAHAASHLAVGADPVDHDLLLNFLANEHIDWTNATQNFSTQGSASLNDNSTTGEIGLNLYGAGAGPQFSSIVQSDAEGAGSELRIGLDETTRTIQIMDRGDLGINYDWGGVSPNPTLYFVNADADKAAFITNFDGNWLFSVFGVTDFITMQSSLYFDFVKEIDSAGDDSYAFFFGTWAGGDGELIDTDAEQSWMRIDPWINQTGTAQYVGLLMDVTETSIGGGVNELMALRVAGADQFTIDRTGAVTTGSWTATAIASAYLGAHAAAHEIAGGDLVDHDNLTNYVANQHINWTAAASNFSTSEDFTLVWADAADHASISQTAVAGIAAVPLINIDDDRTGVTANEVGEATIVIDAAGAYAFAIADGSVDFSANTQAYMRGDTHQFEDIFWTWADANDHVTITQSAVAGIENQPLIYIDDDRTGVTANEIGEATIVIDAEGSYALYIADGWIDFGTATQLFNRGDWNTFEDVFWNWSDTADHADITQTAVAGTATVPLINIDDDRTGVTADTVDEATIVMNAAGTYAFYIQTGQAYFGTDTTQIEDVFVSWADAADHAVIAQAAVAGTEDQALIFINDDRTGATVNEREEATIYIDAEGTYAITVIDGGVYIGANANILSYAWVQVRDNGAFIYGANAQWQLSYDSNAAADDIWTWKGKAPAATDTNAIFISLLNPSGMTDHDNYTSPTLVITNDEGADANDYAGVVIGERAQANVKVAHYFDFYAMTGASDGSVDPSNAELAAIFRIGASGSATPGYATTGGDVLMEGQLEVDGNQQNAGYNRFDCIYWIECFDHGIAANRYSQNWDITSLNTQGNGTNTIDTTPSHITLTTDNNAIGDNEGTISHFQIVERSRQNRSEFGVDLGQTANTQFYCGWNTSQTNAMVAAADEYVIVFFDVSDNANWQIKVGDGATEDIFTSAVAADTNDIRHEIWVETDGTVHWRVNGTELDITGTVDNLMTANLHYLIFGQAQSVTGAAVIIAEIDWVENEKTKAH